MAKAVAYCTCRHCGNEFKKETTKRNRKEADSWKEWVERNYTQCPSCYGKEQREKELSQPPALTVSMLPFSADNPILLVWSGNTMDYKDQIKALGYIWDEPPSAGFFGVFDTQKKQKRWFTLVTVEELQQKIKEAESIPSMIVKNEITEVDLAAYKQIASKEAQKRAEMQKEIAALGEKPKRPKHYPEGHWNGRIYGKSGKYRIYADNKEVSITDDVAKEIQIYQKAIDDYNKKLKEIKSKFQ